ncbi:unnamed protein product [Miscanthus lutarioriparius]|uniref:Uncharacterized protein n=1 Tax=Miscanthus lutarioriparius TaxID=422564 RepID=A0A811Q6R2_9POAL|nr:unnamed protein product [Miscanthus lutarioriparius]
MALSSSRPHHHLLRPLLRGFTRLRGAWRGRSRTSSQAQRVPGQLGARGGAPGGVGAAGPAAQGYAYEVQLMEAERQRKADARAEAARIANQERKAAKLAAAQTRAAERRAFEEDFRQTLMKERAEKLESWRKKEKLKEQKKAEQKELLRKKSSMWLSEDKIEQQILTAIMQTTPL